MTWIASSDNIDNPYAIICNRRRVLWIKQTKKEETDKQTTKSKSNGKQQRQNKTEMHYITTSVMEIIKDKNVNIKMSEVYKIFDKFSK